MATQHVARRYGKRGPSYSLTIQVCDVCTRPPVYSHTRVKLIDGRAFGPIDLCRKCYGLYNLVGAVISGAERPAYQVQSLDEAPKCPECAEHLIPIDASMLAKLFERGA